MTLAFSIHCTWKPLETSSSASPSTPTSTPTATRRVEIGRPTPLALGRVWANDDLAIRHRRSGRVGAINAHADRVLSIVIAPAPLCLAKARAALRKATGADLFARGQSTRRNANVNIARLHARPCNVKWNMRIAKTVPRYRTTGNEHLTVARLLSQTARRITKSLFAGKAAWISARRWRLRLGDHGPSAPATAPSPTSRCLRLRLTTPAAHQGREQCGLLCRLQCGLRYRQHRLLDLWNSLHGVNDGRNLRRTIAPRPE